MTNRIAPPVFLQGKDDIGGAVVRRKFTFNGRELFNNEILTGDEVRSMKTSNFRALRDNGYLQIFPKPRSANPTEAPKAPIRIETVSTAPRLGRPPLARPAPEVSVV